jgi:hypothetical protein
VEEVEVEAADENARVEEGTGPRVDPWPRPGTVIEEQDVYFRESALLEGEQNNLPLVGQWRTSRVWRF